jgi:hypothetical protein
MTGCSTWSLVTLKAVSILSQIKCIRDAQVNRQQQALIGSQGSELPLQAVAKVDIGRAAGLQAGPGGN